MANTKLIVEAVEAAAEGALLPRDHGSVAYLSIETDDDRTYNADVIIATDGRLDTIEQCRRCQVLLRFNLRDFFAFMSQYASESESSEDSSDDGGYVMQQYERNEDEIAVALDKLLSRGKGLEVIDAFSEF